MKREMKIKRERDMWKEREIWNRERKREKVEDERILPWFFTSDFYICVLRTLWPWILQSFFISVVTKKCINVSATVIYIALSFETSKTPSMIIFIVLFFVCFYVFFLARTGPRPRIPKSLAKKKKSPSQNQERSPGFFEFSIKDFWTSVRGRICFFDQFSRSEWRRGGENENIPDDKVQSIGEDIITLPQVAGKTNWVIWLCHLATFRLHPSLLVILVSWRSKNLPAQEKRHNHCCETLYAATKTIRRFRHVVHSFVNLSQVCKSQVIKLSLWFSFFEKPTHSQHPRARESIYDFMSKV